MEKKVNLNIFFNYRHYSPRLKMLLEDVFYKKMHDEKLSSSDAMQQVMQFCNDVDDIEYGEFDFNILSKYSKADKKIMINSKTVASLIDEHKDLDEEALLKNILEKQARNVLEDKTNDVCDITFDDVLNKSGYVSPRKLSDISDDINKNTLGDESAVEDMLIPKIAKKSELNNISNFNIQLTDEDKRFVSTDETLQIRDVQEKINEKMTDNSKIGFENFFPEDEMENKNKPEENNYYQRVGILSKRLNIENEPEDDYSILDAVKRKDSSSSGKFSDFVPDKKEFDYELEDDDDLDDDNSNKIRNKIFSNVKEKVSAFTDKLKNNFARKEEEENEFESSVEDNLYEDEYNYSSNKEEIIEASDSYDYDMESKPDINESVNENNNTNYIKEEIKDEVLDKDYETLNNKFDFNYTDDESDIKIDDKFDNIISAIMKEKQKELEEDEILSVCEDVEEASYNTDYNSIDNSSLQDEHITSVYDSFAEELETVESVKRRRRKR